MNTLQSNSDRLAYEDLERYEAERIAELNSGMQSALKGLQIEIGSLKDARRVATETFNQITAANKSEVQSLLAQMWLGEESSEEKNQDREAEKIAPSSVLNPQEADQRIGGPILRAFARGDVELARQLLERFSVKEPIGYGIHMNTGTQGRSKEKDGHGGASVGVIQDVLNFNGLPLSEQKTPLSVAEMGVGPGKIAWEMFRRAVLPAESRFALIDPSPWISYGERLLNRDFPRASFTRFEGGAETYQGDTPLDFAYAALCSQWIEDNPEAGRIDLLESCLRQMRRNLKQGGLFADAGEIPDDVFGTSPQAAERQLQIGFTGSYAFSDFCRLCERVGFTPAPEIALRRLSMPPLSPDWLRQRSTEEQKIARLIWAMNDHTVAGSLWINN